MTDTVSDKELVKAIRKQLREDRLQTIKEAPISLFPYVCMRCEMYCIFRNKTRESVINVRNSKCTVNPKVIRKHLKRRDAHKEELRA